MLNTRGRTFNVEISFGKTINRMDLIKSFSQAENLSSETTYDENDHRIH